MNNLNKIIKNIIESTGNHKNRENSVSLKENIKSLATMLKKKYENKNFCIARSIGQGRMAEIPWVSISIPSVTNSAAKGHYVAFYFINNPFKKSLILIYTLSLQNTKKDTDKKIKEVKEINELYANNFRLKTKLILKNIKFSNTSAINKVVNFNNDHIYNIDSKNEWGVTKRAEKYRKDSIIFYEIDLNDVMSEKIEDYLDLFLNLYKKVNEEQIYQKIINENADIKIDNFENKKLIYIKRYMNKSKDIEKWRTLFRKNIKSHLKGKDINFLNGEVSTFPVKEAAHIVPVEHCIKNYHLSSSMEEKQEWLNSISNPYNGLLLDPNTHSILDKKSGSCSSICNENITWNENKKLKKVYLNKKYITKERLNFIKKRNSIFNKKES